MMHSVILVAEQRHVQASSFICTVKALITHMDAAGSFWQPEVSKNSDVSQKRSCVATVCRRPFATVDGDGRPHQAINGHQWLVASTGMAL